MKLLKRTNRRVGDKEYVKWYVDLPSDLIEKVGWKEGEELKGMANQNGLVLRKSKIVKS